MKDFYQLPFQNHSIFQTPNLWDSYQNYNYILSDNNQKAVVFDPGDYQPIAKTLRQNQLNLKAIYLTHHHRDHIGAVEQFKAEWNCPVYGFANDKERLPEVTHFYNENDNLDILDLKAQILFLPGHTLGLCAFYFQDQSWLFSSDHLFSLGCGRVFEGSYKQMYESLEKVRQLPDDTLIFSSHEYTMTNLDFHLQLFDSDPALLNIEKTIRKKIAQQQPTVPSFLAFEKKHNPFLRWDDPTIKKKLSMENCENWQVFEKIRKLKDQA